MVEQQHNEHLDHVFRALADPTRREMIRMLATKERSVSDLADPFPISLAAASKHIKVLEEAGLLHRSIQGRRHTCRLTPQSLTAAYEWIRFYKRFWNQQLDALEQELKKSKGENKTRDDDKK